MNPPILSVRHLKTYFLTAKGMVRAVDGASYEVGDGEFVCLIGESGSGKSVSALSILGLIDSGPGIIDGAIYFLSKNLLDGISEYCRVERDGARITILKDMAGWRKKHRQNLSGIRGKSIGIIFQDPVSSLNPLFTVADHIAEAAEVRHGKFSPNEKIQYAAEWLTRVQIPSPREVAAAYPFQLSGGMAQRVMIATALAAEPKLLIADEPTTALDATVQLEILRLLKSLQEQMHLSILFITHDMSIGAHFADRIAVMYAGRVVEAGPVSEIFTRDSIHPYTDGLLHAALKTTTDIDDKKFIKGAPPDAVQRPTGCTFHPRCVVKAELADGGKRCESDEPYEIRRSEKHSIRCWKYETDN